VVLLLIRLLQLEVREVLVGVEVVLTQLEGVQVTHQQLLHLKAIMEAQGMVVVVVVVAGLEALEETLLLL
jgi:hypothetical protein